VRIQENFYFIMEVGYGYRLISVALPPGLEHFGNSCSLFIVLFASLMRSTGSRHPSASNGSRTHRHHCENPPSASPGLMLVAILPQRQIVSSAARNCSRRFVTSRRMSVWNRRNSGSSVCASRFTVGRRQVNFLATRKREHSCKPDEQYDIIEACSPAPFLELFARGTRKGWATWGNQADETYQPTWKTYAHHSQAGLIPEE
jgi:hypothetical protein